MNIDSDKPEENPPEIEIEIEPASGADTSPSTGDSSTAIPDFDDLPDLPPVPDGDMEGLPEIPDDDDISLPPVDGGDDIVLPPVDGGGGDDIVLPPVDGDGSDDIVLPPVDGGGGDDIDLPPVDGTVGKLTLQSVASPSQELTMAVSTEVGKHLCKRMGEDYKFMHKMQMELEKTDSGWQVKPNTDSKNETLLNGSAVVGVQPLEEGDVLSVGRESKGVSKMEMRVSFP